MALDRNEELAQSGGLSGRDKTGFEVEETFDPVAFRSCYEVDVKAAERGHEVASRRQFSRRTAEIDIEGPLQVGADRQQQG